tara:strand:+ start:16 stop:606 length:591 start_codon:yes stop_codon:yes gene_type:complete
MPISINGSGTVTGISVGGLPDGIVDTDMIAANAVTKAKTTVPGITMADAYKVTSSFSGTAEITSNWARDTSRGGGNIGSAMSESSGVFTFPSTGIYLVHFQARGNINNQNNREVIIQIFFTSNNSSYEETANAAMNQYDSNSNTHDSINTQKILDITDVSNQKVKFRVQTNESSWSTYGDSSISFTFVQFLRLGDT